MHRAEAREQQPAREGPGVASMLRFHVAQSGIWHCHRYATCPCAHMTTMCEGRGRCENRGEGSENRGRAPRGARGGALMAMSMSARRAPGLRGCHRLRITAGGEEKIDPPSGVGFQRPGVCHSAASLRPRHQQNACQTPFSLAPDTRFARSSKWVAAVSIKRFVVKTFLTTSTIARRPLKMCWLAAYSSS